MASELDHIALANKNHLVLELLLDQSPPHPEWSATLAFYKAVHVVEAVFANCDRTHSNGHDDRLKRLKSRKYNPIFLHFRPLYVASLIARYLVDTGSRRVYDHVSSAPSYSSFEDYMSSEDVKKRLIEKRLRGVESASVSLLSIDAARDLKRF